MKAHLFWALGAVISSVHGLVLADRQSDSPRVVSLSTQREHIINPHRRDQERRRRRQNGSVEATLDNLQTLYFVNGTLGTPPQPIRMHLDTGSSDMWVNTPSSSMCQQQGSPCSVSGTYTANDSSTYEYLGSYFNISYVDGSGATGDYVTDTFSIGEVDLPDFQFGIGYESSAAQAILGIGYPANEVQVQRSGMKAYDNLPAKMVAEGAISSNAFSLYLNSLQASTGTILFGGVDTAQFDGKLHTLPVEKSGDVHTEFLVTMTSVALGSTTLADDMALAVLLDSGSSLTYLPDDMVEQIFEMVGAVYQESESVAFVDCRLADVGANMTFTFSDPAIVVPISELVLDILQITGRRPTFSNGVEACLFGIAPAGRGTNVLGDTFMRSAYVVFDIDNNEISIAQATYNATSSNVVEIGKGQNAVPSAVAVANPVTATGGASGTGGGDASGASGAGTGLSPAIFTAVVMGVAAGAGICLF